MSNLWAVLTVVTVVIVGVLFSCNLHSPAYVSFDESIETFTNTYGEPHIINDIDWYEDGQVRYAYVYWNILDHKEISHYDSSGNPVYNDMLIVKVWHQPYRDEYWRRWHWGWKAMSFAKYHN